MGEKGVAKCYRIETLHTHINNTYYLYIHPDVRFFEFGENKRKCFILSYNYH